MIFENASYDVCKQFNDSGARTPFWLSFLREERILH
jgi:hypothetical protein